MGDLMVEMVVDILSRLPVKDLLRFKCVSKPWKSLISSDSFRKIHRERHNKSTHPLILTLHSSQDFSAAYEPGTLHDYSMTAFDIYGKVVQQQWTLPISAEDLMILPYPSQSKLMFMTNRRTRRFFSYNPSTRQFFHLPNPACFSILDFELLVDTVGWEFCFGYIPWKDEYILIHMYNKNPSEKNPSEPLRERPPAKWVCEVLSMSISNDNFQLQYNAWRSIEVTTMLIWASDAVFVCGAFYCMVYDENRCCCLLSFDVETEVFSTIEKPTGVFSECNVLEINDELYLMQEDMSAREMDLWKLSDVTNKIWTHKWKINLQSLGFRYFPLLNVFDPNLFDSVLFTCRLEYLQCHNLPNRILRKLGKLEEEEDNTYEIMLEEEMEMLNLEDGNNPVIMLEEEEEPEMLEFKPDWYVYVRFYTSLFTL